MKAVFKKVSIAALLSVGALGVAQAGFVEEGAPVTYEKKSEMVASSNQTAGLVQVGSPTKKQPFVRGFAKEVSLLTALKQIVPTGWHAKKSGDVNVQMNVSWRGLNRDWTDVLNQLAKDHNFSATVNWQTNELTISPAVIGTMSMPVVDSKVISAATNAPRVWTLKAELTLKENLTQWAKEAGWQVSWDAVDYPVTNTVELTGGAIDDENGPLRQVVEAYKTAEQPLSVSFWTNRVIRVENTSYKQVPLKDEMPNYRIMK